MNIWRKKRNNRILFHVLMIIILLVLYSIFVIFKCKKYIFINDLSENLLLSIIAADVFYIFTIVIPSEKNKHIAYEISTNKLDNRIKLILGSVIRLIPYKTIQEISTNNMPNKVGEYKLQPNASTLISTNLRIADLNSDYLTSDWRIDIARANGRFNNMVDGYNRTMTDFKNGNTLSYQDMLCTVCKELKHDINDIILKYGSSLESDYIKMLEDILDSNSMFYLQNFSYMNSEKKSEYIAEIFIKMLELYNVHIVINN